MAYPKFRCREARRRQKIAGKLSTWARLALKRGDIARAERLAAWSLDNQQVADRLEAGWRKAQRRENHRHAAA